MCYWHLIYLCLAYVGRLMMGPQTRQDDSQAHRQYWGSSSHEPSKYIVVHTVSIWLPFWPVREVQEHVWKHCYLWKCTSDLAPLRWHRAHLRTLQLPVAYLSTLAKERLFWVPHLTLWLLESWNAWALHSRRKLKLSLVCRLQQIAWGLLLRESEMTKATLHCMRKRHRLTALKPFNP